MSSVPDNDSGGPPEGEERVPDLHLDRIEELARRAPREIARRADEAIARRVPQLAPSRIRRRFRRRTVALFTLLGAMAVMASAWAVLRETTILREAMESQLSERFGGEVNIRRVQWDGWNRITATDLELLARGWEGDAARVATMRSAQVVFSPWMLLLGRIELVDMEIDGLTVRVIERLDRPGDLSFLALRPKARDGGSLRQPSRAMLRDLRFEFGSASGSEVTILSTQRFDADFSHRPDDASLYEFELTQAEQDGQAITEGRIRLSGTWNERDFSYEATLEPIAIDARILKALPARARRWALRAGLVGKVERAHITGTPERPVKTAEILVRDVSLRERDAVRELEWGRIDGTAVTPIRGDLSVELGEADVRIAGPSVTVTARRALVTPGRPGDDVFRVPVEVTATLDLSASGGVAGALDADDAWLERSLAITPFTLDLRMNGLDARPTADGTARRVELPVEAARALATVGASDWAANVDVSIRRAAGRIGADGAIEAAPIQVRGAIDLTDGRIRNAEVPYPVHGVKGRIELAGDRLLIRGLEAHGNGETTVTIDGEFELGGADPGYEVRVTGRDVLLDREFASSFREPPAKTIFESLLDDGEWQMLHAAGLAPESTRPTGEVDCRLEVRHARDGGSVVDVAGQVTLREVNFILDSFPYPMRGNGRLSVTADRVTILDDGIAIRTLTGGTGHIKGHIDLPRVGGKRIIRTTIDFDVEGDRVTPTLLAAIPPSFESKVGRPEGWPGKEMSAISEILTEFGIEASLSAQGTVRTRPDESDAVRTVVQLRDGSIRPTAGLAAVLRENGLSWPGRMTLEQVNGTIIAGAEEVRVTGANAVHGGGTVRAEGGFSPDGRSGTLEIDVRGFPLERELVRIAEGAATDSALEAWDAISPAGTFDAEVAWNRRDGAQDTYVHVRPLTLSIAETVALTPVCGDMYYRNGELRLDSFDLRGPDTDDTPLRIEAHGTVIGANPDFVASVEQLSVSSPIVSSALRAADATVAEETIRSWRLRGAVDARIELPGRRTGTDWELTVAPGWLAGEHEERPFELRRQDGAVVVGPGTAIVDALTLSFDRGFVTVDGRLGSTSGSSLVGELRVDASSGGFSQTLSALMPSTARRALEAIEFGSSGPLWTRGLRVGIDVPRTGPQRISIIGDLGISDASFRSGIDFDRMDGALAFDLAAVGGNPVGTVGLGMDQLRAMGRRMTAASGSLVFESDSDRVRLENAAATLLGGRMAARGAFEPTEGWEVHVSCANVDFARFVAAGGDTPAAPEATDGGGFLRGRIDARGSIEDPTVRRGSGRFAVEDARMMEFPLGMSFLQLTQLMLPLNASMEEASVDFELDDQRIAIRRLDLSSGTLRLEGSGEVRTSDGALALRLRNRGRVPILSDLYGVVSDQLFVLDVGGTLSDPQPRLTPVPVFAPQPVPEAGSGASAAPANTEQR